MEVLKIKNNKLSVLLANLAMLFCLESYEPEAIEEDLIIESEIQSNVENLEIDVPEVSGAVDNLPWAEDINFLKAQEENGANVLMAAFCTVFEISLPSEKHNVQLAANSLAGTVVFPGEVFSQNKILGPYTEEKGYKEGQSYIGSNITTTIGGGVCKIASTLYNTSIISDLEIIERHNHSMPVAYVPYGQDATVAYGVKDFKFKNNKDYPILIWAKAIDNRLYIGFYGKEKAPEVQWNHKISNVVEAPKYYKKNPELKIGEEKVILEGMNGALVESWITIKDREGNIKTKNLGTSYYMPMPYIIEINQ